MQSNGYDVVINDVNFLKFQGTGYSTLAMCHYYSKYCLSYLMVFYAIVVMILFTNKITNIVSQLPFSSFTFGTLYILTFVL